MKQILVIILVVLLIIGGVALWKQHNGGAMLGSGDVSQRDMASTEKDAMNSGATNVDGQPADAAVPTPSRSDAPGTINGDPVGGTATNQPTSGQYPPAAGANGPTYNLAGPGTAPPTGDTIAPNPPNGAVFTGTGKYQWYRQGDLTWRVDSGTGKYCIAFATMDEWQKPIVYNNGCGSGRG